MEILTGAYRDNNPNALFLLRSPTYVHSLPQQFLKQFVEQQVTNSSLSPTAPSSGVLLLESLKEKIKDKFGNNQDRCFEYDVKVMFMFV
jgi:hypothetical protein